MVFNNVYEMITPPSVLKKQWFVDYFDGDDLKSYWTQTIGSGTPLFAMQDTIDEGFKIESDAACENGVISFNDIRHYSASGSVMNLIIRRAGTNSGFSGLRNGICFACEHSMEANITSTQSFKRLATSAGGSRSFTNTSVSSDEVWANFRLTLPDATSALCHIAGILEVTKTSVHPTADMQPFHRGFQQGGTNSWRIRYLEAYNT